MAYFAAHLFFLIFILNIIVAVLSFGIFSAASISPEKYWIVGFISYLVPFALGLNLIFMVFWLVFGKWKAILSALVLVSGSSFIKSTITIGGRNDYAIKSEGDLDVMSYNVRVFNAYASWKNKDEHTGSKIVEWLSKEPNPDVICFQEFYQNKRSDYLNVVAMLRTMGYPYYYLKEAKKDDGGGLFGMATFSKNKIENKGVIQFRKGSNNMAIYIDINQKGEIIRIFNVHLESMSIDEQKVLKIETNQKEGNFTKLKNGFQRRAVQADKVLKAAKSSPYKVIICGDWNDLPYGYSYRILRKNYENAFEEEGNGLGFTYNGRLSFLRIDNQFYNKTIRLKKFKVYRNMKLSDHFPIMARYNLD